MKVGQVNDPQAVELGRYSLELDLDDPTPEPSRLEPPPGHSHRGYRRGG